MTPFAGETEKRSGTASSPAGWEKIAIPGASRLSSKGRKEISLMAGRAGAKTAKNVGRAGH